MQAACPVDIRGSFAWIILAQNLVRALLPFESELLLAVLLLVEKKGT